MRTQTTVAAPVYGVRIEALHNLFSARILDRKCIPGREGFNEEEEKKRERAEFDSIDDYIEQA